MNYLPFAGYWFFGAVDGGERASFFCSWGLLDAAPALGALKVAVVDFYKRLRDS